MIDYNLHSNIIKGNIQKLIQQGKPKLAEAILYEYEKMNEKDADIYCLRAAIFLGEDKLNEAIAVLENGIAICPNNFDLLFNLGMFQERKGEFMLAYKTFLKAKCAFTGPEEEQILTEALNELIQQKPEIQKQAKKKLMIFVRQGLDSFLDDIIENLTSDFEIKKTIVTKLEQIDQGMAWADLCWFEWCDELIVYGSHLNIAQKKKVICRLHRYEAFTDYPRQVNWRQVDLVVFVSEHIRQIVEKMTNLAPNQCLLIPNGVNLNKFNLNSAKKEKGFNIAWIGYLNLRKNPVLVLQYFKELLKEDSRYQLHFAGSFQDEALRYYFQDMIIRLRLERHVIFHGFIPNGQMNDWLIDKHYLVTGSIAEGHPVGVMEAMSCGLKPVIHYFPGVEEFYPKDYIYYDLDDFKNSFSGEYNPEEYRNFIRRKFSLGFQMEKVITALDTLDIKRQETIDQGQTVADIIEHARKYLEKPNFERRETIKDLTLVIPTFNRSALLAQDIKKGYKLGKQPKIIIDDCSDVGRVQLQELAKRKGRFSIQDFLFHDVNQGVAQTISDGINISSAKYLMVCGDDDLLIELEPNVLNREINRIGKECSFLIPRYVLNLNSNNDLSLGYDRGFFKDMSSKEILARIFQTGEMLVLCAGLTSLRDDMRNCLPEPIFRVSEDYVLVSRLLELHEDKPIKLIDSLVYIRRINDSTLSRTLDVRKLSLHLLSLVVSGYYCLKNGSVTRSEFLKLIEKRGSLIQDLYGFGNDFVVAMLGSLTRGKQSTPFAAMLESVNIQERDLPKEFTLVQNLL